MKGMSIILVVCALLATYGAAVVWRERHNTLETYSEWRSAKAHLALGVNGARSFTVTPISLLGHSLNLGAWHGQQEVALVDSWEDFPEMKLRVFAEGESEWNLIARSLKGGQDFVLRLSNREGHPSAWLKLGKEREFLEKRHIEHSLASRRWVEINLKRSEGRLEAFADKERLSSADWPDGPWQISFRGHSQAGKLLVDDIELASRTKNYAQEFTGHFPFWLFTCVFLLLGGALMLIQWKVGDAPAFGLAIALALGSLTTLYFYERAFGSQYPANVNFLGKITNIESRDQALQRLGKLRHGSPVLLWLGGSQAWGAGASEAGNSAFARLAESFPRGNLDFVNGAISAATLEDQLEVLRIVSARRSLAAVVLTTGVNDANNRFFPEKLKLITQAVKKRGARLLLVPEPTSSPTAPAVKVRQQELIHFALEEGIPFFDLPAVMHREADSGFLWWDFVHLSDAGAALVARSLAPAVQSILIESAEPAAKKGK